MGHPLTQGGDGGDGSDGDGSGGDGDDGDGDGGNGGGDGVPVMGRPLTHLPGWRW